jgi:hypothetical protein
VPDSLAKIAPKSYVSCNGSAAMEDVYLKALKRKKELHIELAELDQFIETYHRLSGRHSPTPSQPDLDFRPAVSQPLTRRWRPHEFADIVERLLVKTGQPLNRYQLVEAIEQQGIQIPSTDKPRFIGTILWRNTDRFVNLKDFGYWLKDRACGFARYTPGSTTNGVSDEDGPAAAHEAV